MNELNDADNNNVLDCQERVLQATLFHPLNLKFPLPDNYIHSFLKKLISQVKFSFLFLSEILDFQSIFYVLKFLDRGIRVWNSPRFVRKVYNSFKPTIIRPIFICLQNILNQWNIEYKSERKHKHYFRWNNWALYMAGCRLSSIYKIPKPTWELF